MPLHHRLLLVLSVLIAAAGIGSYLTIQRLWCDTAAYADAHMRPLAAPAGYVPPPGPIYLENDSYYWLSYAQRIGRGEDWRIRQTRMDNFPSGREVHWSQSISWSMVLFGKIRSLFTRESLFTAIEKASTAINPVLFTLAAIGWFATLAPRFGALPTAIFIAFLSTLGDVGWTFEALRPGHQGFHVVFGTISVLGLLLGGLGLTSRKSDARARWLVYQTPHIPDPRTAWWWFFCAGVATGLAYWVSATIESFFVYPMMGMFVGLLVLVPPHRIAAEELSVQPDLWRLWGLTAGATAFSFYLIEYFPHHMAMRMEVNHPIYDLALIGAGEAMRGLTLLRWGGRKTSWGSLFFLAVALFVAGLPVLLITRGPISWHHMRDPQMLRLHNFIQEFYTYNNFVKTRRLQHVFELYGIVPAVSLLTPLFLLRRNLTIPQVAWIWGTFAFACSFGLVSYLQIRWMGFFACAVCLSAFVAAHFAFGLLPNGSFGRKPLVVGLLVFALLIQPAEFCRRQVIELVQDLRGVTLQNELVTPILNKRIAFALKTSPDRPKAVIGSLDLAPSFGYFADIPCLASFYWENTEGLHEATRFLATKDPDEAREVATRLGVTHVILPPGGQLPNYFYYIAHGHYDTVDAANIFMSKILMAKAPLWIQPDFQLNPVTTRSYSYRGTPISNHWETFRIESP